MLDLIGFKSNEINDLDYVIKVLLGRVKLYFTYHIEKRDVEIASY